MISTAMRLALALLFVASVSSNVPCAPRQMEFGMVCVCNATYCDTVDPVPTLVDGQFVQYTSNEAGQRFEQTFGMFDQTVQPDGVHVTIDLAETYQSVLGFGGAFTDAAGINILKLSDAAQELLLRSYFSADGIELNYGRVPIGGCDFSTHVYTYADDVVNDTSLSSFNLTMEDFTYKIPLIKRALAMSDREIHLLSAAWSPPVWMKTSNSIAGGYLIPDFYQTWADYLIRFLDEYKKEGIEFWSLSTGNEPLGGILPVYGFNSLGWTPATQFAWLRDNLHPTLKGSQHTATKILTLDDQRAMIPWWLDSMNSDGTLLDLIDGIGIHWYVDVYLPASILDRTHEKYPSIFMLGTEACVGDKPWELPIKIGEWRRGELYIKSIIEDLHHWMNGWVDWNLALDTMGGPNWANNTVDAAVIVPDDDSDEFYKQPMYYALGHFAKFVTEGSVRVGLTPVKENKIETIAFQTTDNKVVVVLYNGNTAVVPVSITDQNTGSINLQISAKSFQTIIYNRNEPSSTTPTTTSSSTTTTTVPITSTTEVPTTTDDPGSAMQIHVHLLTVLVCALMYLVL